MAIVPLQTKIFNPLMKIQSRKTPFEVAGAKTNHAAHFQSLSLTLLPAPPQFLFFALLGPENINRRLLPRPPPPPPGENSLSSWEEQRWKKRRSSWKSPFNGFYCSAETGRTEAGEDGGGSEWGLFEILSVCRWLLGEWKFLERLSTCRKSKCVLHWQLRRTQQGLGSLSRTRPMITKFETRQEDRILMPQKALKSSKQLSPLLVFNFHPNSAN